MTDEIDWNAPPTEELKKAYAFYLAHRQPVAVDEPEVRKAIARSVPQWDGLHTTETLWRDLNTMIGAYRAAMARMGEAERNALEFARQAADWGAIANRHEGNLIATESRLTTATATIERLAAALGHLVKQCFVCNGTGRCGIAYAGGPGTKPPEGDQDCFNCRSARAAIKPSGV